MKRALNASVWPLALLALGTTTGLGYPITPVTLWGLVEEADLIVLARVEDGGSDETALLTVKETWKGERLTSIKVRYPAGMICPAPPEYAKGKTVLAFLKKDSDGDWSTVGLSYGTLYPSAKDRPAIKERVESALALQAKGKEPSRREKRRWLVDTAARRATRWDGLYELSPKEDRLHFYYDRDRKDAEAQGLDVEERKRLAHGFVTEPDLDRTFPMVLAVLRGHENSDVDRVAVALMDRLMESRRLPGWAARSMDLVLERFGHSSRRLEPREPEDPWLRDPLLRPEEWSDDELRGIWKEARKKLSVPEVKIPDIPEERVPGVGRDTSI